MKRLLLLIAIIFALPYMIYAYILHDIDSEWEAKVEKYKPENEAIQRQKVIDRARAKAVLGNTYMPPANQPKCDSKYSSCD